LERTNADAVYDGGVNPTRAGVGWALLLVLACGHAPPRQDPSPGEGEVLVGPGAFNHGDLVLAAWLAYGGKLAELYRKHPPPAANQSADDFHLELGAREAQSAFWEEKSKDRPRGTGDAGYAAFDRQVEVWRAGFLPELVLVVHARPGWTVPGPVIAAAKLQEFVTRFAGDYDSNTPVAVKTSSGKLVPDEPGADFPDPDKLPIHPASCGLAREERQAAWKRWQVLEPRLGGLPVSAVDPLDFGKQLIAVRAESAYTTRGATWVSMRVAHIAMLEGYCAVEAKDWPAALAMLTRAVGLIPTDPTPRLELALALASLKRHEEALVQVDRALGGAREGCIAALAWRRRGSILFEMGAFGPARAAYEKSLTLEPGSALARTELAAIADALKQKAGRPTGDKRPFDPPPTDVIHTKCTQPEAR
jgi:hypothetical protein